MRQLESILYELHPAGWEPVPGHHIFRQHWAGLGGHISRNYILASLKSLFMLTNKAARKKSFSKEKAAPLLLCSRTEIEK